LINIEFTLTDKEDRVASDWYVEHDCDKEIKHGGAIGGGLSYIFIPTSIGTVVEVECTCGKSKTIRKLE